MAGVIGSSDTSGTQLTLSGAANAALNYTDIQTFATGDVVTEVEVYIRAIQSGAGMFEVALISNSDLSANRNGSRVWLKEITIPDATPVGWYSIPIPNEAITATNGDELGVAISDKRTGSSISMQYGGTGSTRSQAASDPIPATWVETLTPTRNVAIRLTTAAAASGPTIADVDTDEIITDGQTGIVITGTGFEAVQGTGSVTIDGVTQTVTSWSDTSITMTHVRGVMKFGAQTLTVTNDSAETVNQAITVNPASGYSYVDLTSVATVGQVITTAVLVTGDQLLYENVTTPGGYAVTVNADATFTIDGAAPDGVYTFEVRAWDSSDQTWGTAADQTVTIGTPTLSLTGPSSTTESTATVATGAVLDEVATLILETDDSAYSIAQTIDSQTATTINYVAESGVNNCTLGNPATGIPLEPTKTAAGITAYQIQQTAEDNPVVTTSSSNITINPDSAFDVLQVMIATSNTTNGVSVFGTLIIDVEDDMQFMAPKVVNGMTITWNTDGTFTTDVNQTEAFNVYYFSPTTGQWSCLTLTILEGGGIIAAGTQTGRVFIGMGIGI